MLSQQLVLQQPLLCWEGILGTALLPKGRHSLGVWTRRADRAGPADPEVRSISERKEKL